MTTTAETPSKNDIRSARTRERVLQAAIRCVYELGLQNASTVEITKRAGISRGAMLHHYPSKEDLLGAAYDALLKSEADKFRDVAGDYAEGEVTLDAFIDYLWSRFSSRSFAITLDYVVAARTDPKMRGRVEDARKTYDRALDEIWGQFFARNGDSAKEAKRKLNLTVSLFRGLGLQYWIQSDRTDTEKLVTEWKAHLKELLSA